MADIISPSQQREAAGPGLSYWLGAKVFNQPLAMETHAAAQLQAAIQTNMFDNRLQIAVGGAQMSKFVGSPVRNGGYRVTDDGIAVVPVSGVLLDRGAWLGDFYGLMTSYEGLSEQFRKLGEDDSIKQVVLDIDSGGGMAAGLFDLIVELDKLKAKKRVTAIAANVAASGAYAIGCAAHELFVTRGGIAGSIGVITLHMSYQQMLASAGIEPTIIHAGKHKADGNMFQALSHGARAEMVAGVDEIYDQFVAHVAKYRNMDEEAVRATEARVFSGKMVVGKGLADGVKNFEELLTHVRTQKAPAGDVGSDPNKPAASGRDTLAKPKGERTMSEKVEAKTPAVETEQEKPVTAVSVPSVPEVKTAVVEPNAEPQAGGEKARIEAILTADEAKDHTALANHLAFKTEIGADEALKILASAAHDAHPVAAKPSQKDQLNSALERQMEQPHNSGGVKPDNGSVKKPSFADFAAAAPARGKLH